MDSTKAGEKCGSCHAALTKADIDGGRCTVCGSMLFPYQPPTALELRATLYDTITSIEACMKGGGYIGAGARGDHIDRLGRTMEAANRILRGDQRPQVYDLDDREHAAVMAALRFFQASRREWIDTEFDTIASAHGEPLSNAQIDALCERLNTGEAANREDLEVMRALVLSTSHIKKQTCDELQAAEDRARLTWEHGCIVYIPDYTDSWDDEREDLRPVFQFAKERGFDWVRFDSDGPTVEGLPTYESGEAQEPEDMDDGPGAYHRYDLRTVDGRIQGNAETNDDNDDGIPDDKLVRWEVGYRDRADAMRQTGGSHTGINGCRVEVFIDGERV